MTLIRQFTLLVCLLVAAGQTVFADNFGNIMPLGDSITAGYFVDGGYREPLNTLLQNGGHSYQFVGTVSNWPGDLAAAGQQYHEGHSGYIIDGSAAGAPRPGLYENMASWIGSSGANRPDTILLMIGTNDMNSGGGYLVDQAPQRLDNLVSRIFTLEPNVRLLLASVTPSSNATTETNVQSFNTAVPGIVSKYYTAGNNIQYVDMYSALNAQTDLADTLHPNQTGYNTMGQTWYNALINPVAPPTPPTPPMPPTPPAMVVNGSHVSQETDNSSPNGYATASHYTANILTNDLIDANSNTLADWNRSEAPFFESTTLNDGQGHPADTGKGSYWPETFGAGDKLPVTYTYTLDTSDNTLGYDISEIRSYAGWSQNGSALADQRYEVLISIIGDASFTSFGIFEYAPFDDADTAEAGATQMILTAEDGGLIATGVDAIQFILLGHGYDNAGVGSAGVDGTVYHEFDVIGTATVPEPTTAILLGLGGLSILHRKKAGRHSQKTKASQP